MTDRASDAGGQRRWPLPLLVVLGVDLLFLWPLLDPLPGGRLAVGAMLAGLVALSLLAPARLATLDRALRRNEGAQRVALLLSSLIVTVGGLEYLARGLTVTGLVEPYSAMRTMLPAGVEDWRLAHLTADRHRQLDPELLWRPVAREPYNRQRFKGPLIEEDRPPGTVRIFCYGDSNTDGPPRGGWAERLGARLAMHAAPPRYEVVNAGVTGYSSYQGRLRYARDATRYRPDLVLVSFGWNDLAPALGAPDRSFRPPTEPFLVLQRLLLEYDLMLVARRYWPRRQAPPPSVGPRVSAEDYATNLQSFIDTAVGSGGRAVLLTRPHREREPVLAAQRHNWRWQVPAYNRIVRRLAGRGGSILIDVQRRFADRPELFVDECHFTPAGHQRMAELIERQLSHRGLLAAARLAGDAAEPTARVDPP
jgi:lysophospholipase L1-like esterase